MHPALTTVLDDVLLMGLCCVGSLEVIINNYENQNRQLSRSLAVEPNAHSQHRRVHQEFKRLHEILVDVLC